MYLAVCSILFTEAPDGVPRLIAKSAVVAVVFIRPPALATILTVKVAVRIASVESNGLNVFVNVYINIDATS